MNKKFILLSLIGSLAFVEVNYSAAPTENILEGIEKIKVDLLKLKKKDIGLRCMLDNDVEDLLEQVKTLIPVLAAHRNTEKFIGDLNAFIPQYIALAVQGPDFIEACRTIKPAMQFGQDAVKIITRMDSRQKRIYLESQSVPSQQR